MTPKELWKNWKPHVDKCTKQVKDNMKRNVVMVEESKTMSNLEMSQSIKKQAHENYHILPWWRFILKHFWKRQYVSQCNQIKRELNITIKE